MTEAPLAIAERRQHKASDPAASAWTPAIISAGDSLRRSR